MSVKQLIFLTFYLKTNKVRIQIYSKLTVKIAETDSKIDSKTPKNLPKSFINLTPCLNNITFLFRVSLRRIGYYLKPQHI